MRSPHACLCSCRYSSPLRYYSRSSTLSTRSTSPRKVLYVALGILAYVATTQDVLEEGRDKRRVCVLDCCPLSDVVEVHDAQLYLLHLIVVPMQQLSASFYLESFNSATALSSGRIQVCFTPTFFAPSPLKTDMLLS